MKEIPLEPPTRINPVISPRQIKVIKKLVNANDL